MRQDVEAPPPAQQGAVLTPPPPPPAAAAAAPHRNPPSTTTAPEASATSFIASVQKVFAPCVGVVDAASLFMGNCRFGKDTYHDAGDRMRLKTTGMHYQQQQKLNQKRQCETLEIPSHGGFFDDDVSAISAHTLEEMERLRQAHHRSNPSRLQMLTPPNQKYSSGSSSHDNRKKGPPYRHSANRSDFGKAARGAFSSKQQLWDMHPQPPHPLEEEECSIGVSTSGSSSAEDEPARITTRGSNRATAENRQVHKATTTSARYASA